MAPASWKLPLPQPPRVARGYDVDTPTHIEYDEVIFDYRTNRYLTLSQQRENDELRKQLECKEADRKKNLKSIIGYFYKARN